MRVLETRALYGRLSSSLRSGTKCQMPKWPEAFVCKTNLTRFKPVLTLQSSLTIYMEGAAHRWANSLESCGTCDEFVGVRVLHLLPVSVSVSGGSLSGLLNRRTSKGDRQVRALYSPPSLDDRRIRFGAAVCKTVWPSVSPGSNPGSSTSYGH